MIKRISLIFISAALFLNCVVFQIRADSVLEFPDVVKDSWYSEAVSKLTRMGVIHGFPDGTFRPESAVKVDEFIKLTLAALGYKDSEAKGYWAEGYIQEAYRRGLIIEGEIWDLRRQINREEMGRVVVRALGNIDLERFEAYQKNISDMDEIDPGYLKYVLAGYGMGIIAGIDGSFMPGKEVTRKEACVMVLRLIDEEERLDVKPLGIVSGFVRRKDMQQFTHKQISDDPDEILSRQEAAGIIYDHILREQKSYESIIPKETRIVRPLISEEGRIILSDTYKAMCLTNRSIEQNLSALQVFEIIRKFEDGSSKKILNINTIPKTDPKDLVKASELDARRPFDHTRFEDIFSDAKVIAPEYKEAVFRLYDLGIMDLCSYSRYSLDLFCAPEAAFTEKELEQIKRRLKQSEKRNAVDEKEFGINDSWGKELFGSIPYTFRFSEKSALYIYNKFSGLEPAMTRIYPGKEGMIMAMVLGGEPYFDDHVTVRDNWYINSEQTTLTDFINYDIRKYEYLVPAGYGNALVKDLRDFAYDANKKMFKGCWGSFCFEAEKYKEAGREMVFFRYAFRGEETK
jgi:hypothetical protein